jgi:ubiquinone/menaquinone biosynthesis C-methylase UbiE
MRDAARDRVVAARARGLEVEVVDAVAEELPLPDASIDAILFAYVLCSVDDVPGALAEAWRVLRPGGTVHVLEHVAARPGSVTSWVQRATAPVWPRLTGGCHADRDTRAALVEAGFDDDGLRDTTLANVPVVSPTLVGTARRG